MEVFPVRVELDGQVRGTCKMFVDGTGTRIYEWDRDQRTANLVLDTTFTAEGGPRRWVIRDMDGDLPDIEVNKTGGCGCSHPMKRWRPEAGAARVVAG